MPYGFAYDPVGSRCSGGAQPGARVLSAWAVERWGLPRAEIYACRPSRAGSSLSTHGEGRGIDLYVHVRALESPPTPDEKAVGDGMAAFFEAHADAFGVQRVIWLDRSWDSRSRTWRGYTGPFHGNHNHVELCWAAARNLTRVELDAITQEDDMTPEQARLLEEIAAAVVPAREIPDVRYRVRTIIEETVRKVLDEGTGFGVTNPDGSPGAWAATVQRTYEHSRDAALAAGRPGSGLSSLDQADLDAIAEAVADEQARRQQD